MGDLADDRVEGMEEDKVIPACIASVRCTIWIIGVALAQMLLVTFGCSGMSDRESGVAYLSESQTAKHQQQAANQPNPLRVESPPTDEEITTRFAASMRENGHDVSDPVLHSDGTVNWMALKEDIANDPNYQSKSKAALNDCLPVLEEVTFSKTQSKENEVELQDGLLEFAQCLRDSGIDVPDPQVRDDTRGSMKSVLEGLRVADSRIERIIDLCSDSVFGSSGSKSVK